MSAFLTLDEAAALRLELWKAGLTQRQVADQIGITESALSDYFRGRRPFTAEQRAEIRRVISEIGQKV